MQLPEVRQDHPPHEPVRFVCCKQRSVVGLVQVYRGEHRFAVKQRGTFVAFQFFADCELLYHTLYVMLDDYFILLYFKWKEYQW